MDPLMFSLFWVFGWVILLLFAWFVRSGRRQQRLELAHKERMMAMEKGIPLPELPDNEDPARRPLVAEAFGQIRLNPRWPLGVGALSIMLGIGTSLALWLSQEDYHNRVWSFGLIGVFLGFGLMLHYWLTRPQGRS
jgi:uncharacterized membrane protein YfcA